MAWCCCLRSWRRRSAACSSVCCRRSSGEPGALGTLREGRRGAGERRTRERARAVLVAGEVALAMALLTGAGVLIRTAWKINRVDPGFDGHNVLTARVLAPQSRFPDLASGARIIGRSAMPWRRPRAYSPQRSRLRFRSVRRFSRALVPKGSR